MTFTSANFLIMFFPICIVAMSLMKKEYRNVSLCIFSVIFYSWCGIKFLILIVISATLAYVFGRLIENVHNMVGRRLILILAFLYNLGVLFCYKYLFELFPNLHSILETVMGQDIMSSGSPTLPLGISFYTFSALSYILDIYWEKCSAEKNILNIYLYIMFFPKVVQGPIMRYTDFRFQLHDRNINIEKLDKGFERFIKGMFKKVMVADQIQSLVTYSFSNISSVGTIPAWIGLFAYLLQLYYDFSGYSDMAIGLGYMVGFDLPENFNHPYMSASVGEFWRRWHISLGEWFQDYVYTPVSKTLISKKMFNNVKNPLLLCDFFALLCVWSLMGIWHGSGMKFLAYGMWYFLFIEFERIRNQYRKQRRKKKKIKGKKKTNVVQDIGDRLLAIIAVIFGQVIFRADSLYTAVEYWKKMISWDTADGVLFIAQFNNYTVFVLVIGIIFCFPIYGWFKDKIFEKNLATQLIYRILLIVAAFVAFCFAISEGYSAFLYEVF